MPAAYHDLRDRVTSAVDAQFAETLEFCPMAGPAPDKSRAAIDVVGVLRTGEMEPRSILGGVRQGKERLQVAGATALLALRVAEYAGLDIRGRDSLQAKERPGEPWYKVLYIDRRNHTRILVYLGDS